MFQGPLCFVGGSQSAGLTPGSLPPLAPHHPRLLASQQLLNPSSSQLTQALSGRFNSHVHVEYEWRLLHEDLDESDDDVDEKLQVSVRPQVPGLS